LTALSLCGPAAAQPDQDGLPVSRGPALLWRIDLAPRGPELRRAGWRPERRRMGRPGFALRDEVNPGRQSVLHYAFAAAASGRHLHGVRPGGRGARRARCDRAGRAHWEHPSVTASGF